MNRRRSGCVIVFSGLDGSGKSTQIDLLIQQLRAEGEDPVYLWTRGGYTELMEKAKRLARHLLRRQLPPPGYSEQRARALGKGWVRVLWLTLAMLDLMRVYGIWVRWLRWRGHFVICDRYLWDTRIDFRMNFGKDNVERWWLWRLLTNLTPLPDIAFLLLIPVAESIRRSELKGEPFRNSDLELEARLHQYKILAEEGHMKVLDGSRSILDLQRDINQTIAKNQEAANSRENYSDAH